MSDKKFFSQWAGLFYDLYKRHVEAVEIQSEAVLEIREILVRSSGNSQTSEKTQEERNQ